MCSKTGAPDSALGEAITFYLKKWDHGRCTGEGSVQGQSVDPAGANEKRGTAKMDGALGGAPQRNGASERGLTGQVKKGPSPPRSVTRLTHPVANAKQAIPSGKHPFCSLFICLPYPPPSLFLALVSPRSYNLWTLPGCPPSG